MPYRQFIDNCFAQRIGVGGLEVDAYAEALVDAGRALEDLRVALADGGMAPLRLAGARADLVGIEAAAARLARFDDLVVLGAGGSSLGGQTLAALAEARRDGPRLHFADNIDPASFARLIDTRDPARTGYLAISKSGTTAETLAQTLVALDAQRRALGDTAAEHFTVVTEPGASPLRGLAERWGLPVLDHDPDVAGRFSVLSLVGLVPALAVGLDVVALREGAAEVLDETLRASDASQSPPAMGAAVSIGLARGHGISQTVMMPYVDRLTCFAQWYRQLWAESLGKDGQGTTPIDARGATDQHSQLQLYLAGPRDKMFTLIALDAAGTGPAIPSDLADDPGLGYLEGKTIGDLIDAEQRATADVLAENGRPVRVFRLETLDERVLGGLLMHFMIETILAARILGVDPFDQPAVDAGKARARAYLAGETAAREAPE